MFEIFGTKEQTIAETNEVTFDLVSFTFILLIHIIFHDSPDDSFLTWNDELFSTTKQTVIVLVFLSVG